MITIDPISGETLSLLEAYIFKNIQDFLPPYPERELNHAIEVYQRIKSGSGEAGDSFFLLRYLIKSFNCDTAWVILQLARLDDVSALTWQLNFTERKNYIYKDKRKAAAAKIKKLSTQKRNYEIFVRVMEQRKRGYSVSEAMDLVADGGPEMSDSLFPNIEFPRYSYATVRAAYKSGLKRAKAEGFYETSRGMFAPRKFRNSLAGFRQAGRPKKRGKFYRESCKLI